MSDQVKPQILQTAIGQFPLGEPRKNSRYNWLPIVVAGGVLAVWYFLTRGDAAAFAVATPQAVVREFIAAVLDGSLIRHTATTLAEILMGFTLGVSSAFILGYGIAHNRLLERAVGPY